MAFYQYPGAMYGYPMPPFPNQDFYPHGPPHPHHVMYGPDGGPPHGPVYFDQPAGPGGGPGAIPGAHHGHHHHGHHHHHQMPAVVPRTYGKAGFGNRKDSADSGISDFSAAGSSRKTSAASGCSGSSILEEPSSLDDVKEETPYEEPDDDLCEQIAQQVEFYFSDANITKDKFLLKHVRRNKEGFVSLKLISSFKRVKHLTKDWRQVAAAIERKSDKLEVNDVKTKVRRTAALPEYDETTPSRTVVALNLPLERPTIEGVAEIFSACGDIVLIRILRPGNPIPADIKPFANKHPEMTEKVCALVEYERTEFAHKAVADLGTGDDDEDGLKVMELTAPPPKTTKNKEDKKKQAQLQLQAQQVLLKQQQAQGIFQQSLVGHQQRRFSHAGFNIPPHHPQSPEQQALMAAAGAGAGGAVPRRRISLNHNMKFASISEEQQHFKKAAGGELNPDAPTFQMQQQRRLSRPPFMHPAAAMEAAAHAACAAAAASAQQHAAAAAAMMSTHGPSPWMMRRLSAIQNGDFAAGAATGGLTLPPNVVRMPRGPDKGKGFQRWCRSRMETQPQPQKKSHAVPIVAPPAEVPKKAEEEDKKEEASAEEEKDHAPAAAAAAPAEEPEVDGAAAAAPAAIAGPEVNDADLVVAAAADSCSSDSGNEDVGSVSSDSADLEPVAVAAVAEDNERSR